MRASPGRQCRPLLGRDVRPHCFRMVSRLPQNGFICGFLARFLARFLPGLRKVADRPKMFSGAVTALGRKTIMKTTKLTRRGLLGAASATWATAILGQPAKAAAAEVDFKLGV